MDGILPLGNGMSLMNVLPALSAKANVSAGIDAAAREFEAMFATQLIQPMFNTISVNETFGGGHGEEVMRSFLTQEYGKLIAKSGLLGIASQVKAEMLRAQEGANARGGAASRSKNQKASPYASAKGSDHVFS